MLVEIHKVEKVPREKRTFFAKKDGGGILSADEEEVCKKYKLKKKI